MFHAYTRCWQTWTQKKPLENFSALPRRFVTNNYQSSNYAKTEFIHRAVAPVFQEEICTHRQIFALKISPILVAHPWHDPIWECPPPRAVAVPNKIRITKFGSTTAMAGRMNQTFLLGSTLPCIRQILPIARLCTAFIHTFIFFPNLILRKKL